MKFREILFLAHRTPYPPQKGDKIRSWNILSHLSQRYTVHLACFVDSVDDWRYVDHLREICGECYFAELKPTAARIRCLSGLLTGMPLTLPFYRNARLSAWVQDLVERREVGGCYVFSSAMAQYVTGDAFAPMVRVMDFVDVDSEKWRQYALRRPWPASWLYRREGQKLLRFETAIAATFDASILVSATEVELFEPRAAATETIEKVTDPVCGMELGKGEVAAHLTRNGVEHSFCSDDCLRQFVRAPEKYTAA